MLLKFYRKKAGFSQAELAKRCGISSDSISRYEKGTREPRISELIKLSVALGVTEADLLKKSVS